MSVTLDIRQAKRLEVNSPVRILDGPHRDKQGIIKHIFKSFVFVHDAREKEHSGIMVARSRQCALADGSLARPTVQGYDVAGMNGAEQPDTPAAGAPGFVPQSPSRLGGTESLCSKRSNKVIEADPDLAAYLYDNFLQPLAFVRCLVCSSSARGLFRPLRGAQQPCGRFPDREDSALKTKQATTNQVLCCRAGCRCRHVSNVDECTT